MARCSARQAAALAVSLIILSAAWTSQAGETGVTPTPSDPRAAALLNGGMPPTVTLTSPTNNAIFYVGDAVLLSAEALDPDGTVTNVEFFVDFTLVGSITSRPYQLNLIVTNGPINHRFQARAIDDWGMSTVSDEVLFQVTYPPPVNDDFIHRTTFTGAFVTVNGDNLYATHEAGEPTAGYKSVWWSWTALTSGTYTVTAIGLPGTFQPFLGLYRGSELSNLVLVASDIFNGSDSSYAARVTIQASAGETYPIAVGAVGGSGGGLSLNITPTAPPTVTLASPTNNATFYVGDAILLSAEALDPDGTVTNVEFFVDFTLVGSITSPPYQINLIVTNGPINHRFQARATDDWGMSTVSDEVLFQVTYPPPVNDDFIHRTTFTGAFVTMNGDNLYATHETGEPTAGYKSVWWSWTAPTSGIYTVTAIGLPGGFLPFLGLYRGSELSNLVRVASDVFDGSDSSYAARVTIQASAGETYPIAVGAVGGSGGGLSLNITPTAPPTVTIVTPTNNATFYVGNAILLSAEALDPDGTVTNVEFFVDFTLVGSITSRPYQLNLIVTNGPINHRLRARAIDDWGMITTSDEVFFQVTYPPPANDDFANGTPLTGAFLTATGNTAYATHELGEPTAGYKSLWWIWTAPTSGTYTVTAIGMPGGFFPFLGVYRGSALANLNLFASDTFNGQGNTYAARVDVEAMGGTTYAVAVSTVLGSGGGCSLCVAPQAMPELQPRFDAIAIQPDGSRRLRFTTGPTNNWMIEASANHVDWETIGSAFPSRCSLETTERTETIFPHRFYRLKAQP